MTGLDEVRLVAGIASHRMQAGRTDGRGVLMLRGRPLPRYSYSGSSSPVPHIHARVTGPGGRSYRSLLRFTITVPQMFARYFRRAAVSAIQLDLPFHP